MIMWTGHCKRTQKYITQHKSFRHILANLNQNGTMKHYGDNRLHVKNNGVDDISRGR